MFCGHCMDEPCKCIEKCQHQKVYANYILASNPPQYPWICAICGEDGRDRGRLDERMTFEELKKKFNEN